MLKAEVDDSLGVVILETSEFSHLAFLVDDLYFLNHLGGDILGGSLYVIAKEFLAVDADALNLFAVDSYFAFFVHFYSVHFL